MQEIQQGKSFKINCFDGQLVETTFPEICLSVRKIKDAPYDIIMDNRHARKVYQLPDEILEHYDWIINAHAESLKYNSRTVRLDDFSKNGNRITLTYSNATYWIQWADRETAPWNSFCQEESQGFCWKGKI